MSIRPTPPGRLRPLSIPVRALLRIALALAATPWVPVPAAAQDPYFPPAGGWERRDPGAMGMDAEKLRAAIGFALDSENPQPRDLAMAHPLSWGREPYDSPVGPFTMRGGVSGLVIRGGYIVAEWGDVGAVEMTFSVTKSFLSSTVGLLWASGRIPDLHEPVRTKVPLEQFASDHNARITWDHLLRQTSDWEGTLWGKPDWADRPGQNLAEYMARPRDEPGTAWKYNDVRVNVLALAALHVAREPLPNLLRREIMDPIGASPTWRWHGYDNSWIELDGVRIQSVSGGGHWGGGMFLSAMDQARFGYLTLRKGRWGERQLLPEAWFDQARTPTGPNPGYGFMNYFLNTGGESIPGAPESAYTHRGAGNNILYVDEENDLLVVVRWIRGGAINDFLGKVLEATRPIGP